jgi:hypothetical protein
MTFKKRMENWICNWVDLLCAILRLTTFGYVSTKYDLSIRSYFMDRYFRNAVNKNQVDYQYNSTYT